MRKVSLTVASFASIYCHPSWAQQQQGEIKCYLCTYCVWANVYHKLCHINNNWKYLTCRRSAEHWDMCDHENKRAERAARTFCHGMKCEMIHDDDMENRKVNGSQSENLSYILTERAVSSSRWHSITSFTRWLREETLLTFVFSVLKIKMKEWGRESIKYLSLLASSQNRCLQMTKIAIHISYRLGMYWDQQENRSHQC